MKKLMYAVAALMAVAACSKGELNQPKPVNEGSEDFTPTVITAYTDNAVEKTALNGRNIVWKTTDNAMAWSATAAYTSVSTKVSEDGTKAEFTFDTQDELLYVAYPAETATTCENGAIATCIPTSQKAVEDGFADGVNFAVGKLKGTETLMQNVGALMCVEVKDENITSIRLSATGVAGASTAVMDGDDISAVDAGDANSIRLGGTIEKDKSYYFVVYPGNYSSLELRFANNQGKIATLTNNKGLTLGRNGNTVIYKAEVPAAKWVDGIDIDEYKGTSIKPGTADNLCMKVEGTYLEGDKVYVSYNGASATELSSDFYKIEDGVLSVYTHRDYIGKTVQYFLHRGESDYKICEPVTVATPEVAEGYIVDGVLLNKLKAVNADVASCFDICNMVILEKAATVNPYNATVKNLNIGASFTTLEGIELFTAWESTAWNASDIYFWNSNNLVVADMSKWTAKVHARLTSCSKLETAILGPNMYGGEFGGAAYKVIDISRSGKISHINLTSTLPKLELLDMRADNCLSGIGITLTKLADESITDYSGLTIRIKADFYLSHTYNDAWKNGIYKAWQKGATVEVYKTDDKTVLLGTVPAFAVDPDALPAGTAYDPDKNWHWDKTDIKKYTGTSTKPGTAEGLCIQCSGTLREGDKVYVSYNGAEAAELSSDFYKSEKGVLSIYTHRDHIGKKVQYFLHRDETNFELSNSIDVLAPEPAEGYIVDGAWLKKLKGCNADVASCFDVCDMVILEKAATVNPFASVKNLSLTDTAAKTLDGMELFSAWSGTNWDKADIYAWSNNSLVNVDLSKWEAKVYIRLTSCSKIENVVLGPNMYGGEFCGTASTCAYKVIDFSNCASLSKVSLGGTDKFLPNLELLDIRTGNCQTGMGHDFKCLGVDNVSDRSKLTIRIKADYYLKHTYANAWQNGIYKAWQKGATVEVYKTDDKAYKLGTVPAYATDPDALPADNEYVEGKNWHWEEQDIFYKYTGTSTKPGTAEGLAIAITGKFEQTDKVLVSLAGAAATELGAEFYSLTENTLKLYTHADNVGKKIQYFLQRGGKNYDLTDNIDVVAPEVSEGYIVDPVFRKGFAEYSGTKGFFDVTGMVTDFDGAKNYIVPLSGSGSNRFFLKTLSDATGKNRIDTIAGFELFENLMGSDRKTYTIIDFQSNNNLYGVLDFSAYKGQGAIYISHDQNVTALILGENMQGFYVVDNPKLKVLDLSRCKKMSAGTGVYFIIASSSTKYSFELLDLRMPAGSDYALTLEGLKSQDSYSGCTIKITSHYWDYHYGDAKYWPNVLEAWKRGATVEVYGYGETIDTKLGTVPMYDGTNEGIFPPGGKNGPVEGNWRWQE